MMVVLLHFGGVRYIGEYAVFGFFSLSGYLMTLIMQQNYGYTVRGIAGYGLNRFLRIYPIYWVACLISILILLLLNPENTTALNANYFLPGEARNWVKNLGLILKFRSSPILISPAWALTVELFFYACIGLGLSRSRRIVLIWFSVSVVSTVYMVASDASWGQRYFTIQAASLPFSTGAVIYHWREELSEKLGFLVTNSVVPALMMVLILGNWAVGDYLGTQRHWNFYINYALCCLMIPVLFRRTELTCISRQFDSWLGDLSYPIYLVHAPLGFMLLYGWKQLGLDIDGPGYLMFVISVMPLVGVAWLMSVGVERPIEWVRSAVKRAI